jgi:hypothetical protein
LKSFQAKCGEFAQVNTKCSIKYVLTCFNSGQPFAAAQRIRFTTKSDAWPDWAIGVNYAAYKTENRFGKSQTFPFVVTIILRRFEPRISADIPFNSQYLIVFNCILVLIMNGAQSSGRFAGSIAPDWMLQQNAVSEGAERTRAAATAHKAAISLGVRSHRQNCVLLNQSSIFFSFYSCSIGTTS